MLRSQQKKSTSLVKHCKVTHVNTDCDPAYFGWSYLRPRFMCGSTRTVAARVRFESIGGR